MTIKITEVNDATIADLAKILFGIEVKKVNCFIGANPAEVIRKASAAARPSEQPQPEQPQPELPTIDNSDLDRIASFPEGLTKADIIAARQKLVRQFGSDNAAEIVRLTREAIFNPAGVDDDSFGYAEDALGEDNALVEFVRKNRD